MIRIIEPFINFCVDADLKKLHELFGKDLDLSSLDLQYKELVEIKSQLGLGSNLLTSIHVLLQNAENSSNYEDVLVVLCRIQICTPHSADVE